MTPDAFLRELRGPAGDVEKQQSIASPPSGDEPKWLPADPTAPALYVLLRSADDLDDALVGSVAEQRRSWWLLDVGEAGMRPAAQRQDLRQILAVRPDGSLLVASGEPTTEELKAEVQRARLRELPSPGTLALPQQLLPSPLPQPSQNAAPPRSKTQLAEYFIVNGGRGIGKREYIGRHGVVVGAGSSGWWPLQIGQAGVLPAAEAKYRRSALRRVQRWQSDGTPFIDGSEPSAAELESQFAAYMALEKKPAQEELLLTPSSSSYGGAAMGAAAAQLPQSAVAALLESYGETAVEARVFRVEGVASPLPEPQPQPEEQKPAAAFVAVAVVDAPPSLFPAQEEENAGVLRQAAATRGGGGVRPTPRSSSAVVRAFGNDGPSEPPEAAAAVSAPAAAPQRKDKPPSAAEPFVFIFALALVVGEMLVGALAAAGRRDVATTSRETSSARDDGRRGEGSQQQRWTSSAGRKSSSGGTGSRYEGAETPNAFNPLEAVRKLLRSRGHRPGGDGDDSRR